MVRKHKVITIMAYSTHHTRSPQRQLPLLKAAAHVFGPSQTDRQIGDYRHARNAVQGWKASYAAACAKLALANTHDPKWRRLSQRDAFRAINAVAKAMRANYRALDAASAALLALGVSVEAL